MFGFIEKDSNLKIEDAVYNHVLEAGLGWMHDSNFAVKNCESILKIQ